MPNPKRLSAPQARMLRFFIDHKDDACAAAESWSAYRTRAGTDLDWRNHERTLASVRNNGWLDNEDQVTETGLTALIEFVHAGMKAPAGT